AGSAKPSRAPYGVDPPRMTGRPSGRLIIVAYQRSEAMVQVSVLMVPVVGVNSVLSFAPCAVVSLLLPPATRRRPSTRYEAMPQKLLTCWGLNEVWCAPEERPDDGVQMSK